MNFNFKPIFTSGRTLTDVTISSTTITNAFTANTQGANLILGSISSNTISAVGAVITYINSAPILYTEFIDPGVNGNPYASLMDSAASTYILSDINGNSFIPIPANAVVGFSLFSGTTSTRISTIFENY